MKNELKTNLVSSYESWEIWRQDWKNGDNIPRYRFLIKHQDHYSWYRSTNPPNNVCVCKLEIPNTVSLTIKLMEE